VAEFPMANMPSPLMLYVMFEPDFRVEKLVFRLAPFEHQLLIIIFWTLILDCYSSSNLFSCYFASPSRRC
jgi:hypothetical protein